MDRQSGGQSGEGWQVGQAYAMAALCLIAGLALGYFLRGSQSAQSTAPAPSNAASEFTRGGSLPSMDQMKQMADTKAQPLLKQLRSEPSDAGLLVQLGNIYKATHQFKQAAEYYGKSLEIRSSSVVRVEMASCLYYAGEADGALKELQIALQDEPHNVNALFNVGMIKWQAQRDGAGAVAAWQSLLKNNPDIDAEKRAQVEKLISETRQPRVGN
jgi:cytochrome c-type biogenesis protein CcmH/NrfG